MDFNRNVISELNGDAIDLKGKYFIPFNMYYKSLFDNSFNVEFTERGKHSYTYYILKEYGKLLSLGLYNEAMFAYVMPEFGVLDTSNDRIDLYYNYDGGDIQYELISYRGERIKIEGSFDLLMIIQDENEEYQFDYDSGDSNPYEYKSTFVKLMKVIQRGVLSFKM